MALYSYFDKILVLIIFLTPKLMDSLHIIRIWWAQFLINEKSIYQVNRHVQIILTWSPAFFTRSYLTWARGVSFHIIFLVHFRYNWDKNLSRYEFQLQLANFYPWSQFMHNLHLGTSIEFREYVYLLRVLKAFLIFQESFRILVWNLAIGI